MEVQKMIDQTKSFHQATKKTITLNDLCDLDTLQKLGRPCLNSVMQYFRVSGESEQFRPAYQFFCTPVITFHNNKF